MGFLSWGRSRPWCVACAGTSLRNLRRALLAATALCGLVTATPQAQAQTTSWTDATGSWFNPANWDNGVPNPGTTVTTVGNGGTAQIFGGPPAVAGAQLDVTGNSSVLVGIVGPPPSTLNVTTLNVSNGGTIQLNNGILNTTNINVLSNGTFIAGPGPWSYAGLVTLNGGTFRVTSATASVGTLTFAANATSTLAATSGSLAQTGRAEQRWKQLMAVLEAAGPRGTGLAKHSHRRARESSRSSGTIGRREPRRSSTQ